MTRPTAAATLPLLLVLAGARIPAAAGPSVRITSPIGRTGAVATVRIVAQVRTPGAHVTVRFYVDGRLVGTDTDGPPYAVEWVDENPFERNEISVEADDGDGQVASDKIVLEPFEVVEVSEVRSVLVEAAVYDRGGRFVSGLAPAQFAVFEDGARQDLELMRQETVPVTLTLLVDASQSLAGRTEFLQRAARRLTSLLRRDDRLVVAPFDRKLRAWTGPTADKQTVAQAIDAIRWGGGTAIFDSVVEMANRLPPATDRRAVVLLTDGYDENSSHTVAEAIAAAASAHIGIYPIAIGGVAGVSLRGQAALQQMAQQTGGRAFFPVADDALVATFERLSGDIENRYLLTYTPKNQEHDGRWHAIKVETSPTGYTVQARPGYTAPMPPPVRASIEFTAIDAQGGFADVSRDDLVVVEDGVEQAVDTFQEAVDPVSVVLALDESGSMKRSADAASAAAADFVQSLRPQDKLALNLFADHATFAHDLSTDRQLSLEAIAGYEPAGGTALWDALSDALARLRTQEGRRAIVVVTDGRDEDNPGTAPGSVRTFDDVVALLKETGAAIYTIGIGTKIDRDALQRLAAASGGSAFFPSDAPELHDQYARIVDTLRRRYLIAYTSTNPSRDGGWRHVELRSRQGGVTFRAREGYFAPGPGAVATGSR